MSSVWLERITAFCLIFTALRGTGKIDSMFNAKVYVLIINLRQDEFKCQVI